MKKIQSLIICLIPLGSIFAEPTEIQFTQLPFETKHGIKLVDAKGQVIGRIVAQDSRQSFVVDKYSRIIRIDYQGRVIFDEDSQILYAERDCRGTPYLSYDRGYLTYSSATYPKVLLKFRGKSDIFIIQTAKSMKLKIYDVLFKSSYSDGKCTNYGDPLKHNPRLTTGPAFTQGVIIEKIPDSEVKAEYELPLSFVEY
jgi:hypothetical protein